MKKQFFVTLLAIVLLFFGNSCTAIANNEATIISEVYIPSETSVIEYNDTLDLQELSILINDNKQKKKELEELIEQNALLNNLCMAEILNKEWSIADKYEKYYTQRYKEIEQSKWLSREQEYPDATYIWKYLKSCGYNDYVCAGIMGNLMAEVGGQTLDIHWWAKGNGYYGICQWNKKYSKVWNCSLEQQLIFLTDTIEYEINTFGYAYKKNFKYNDFCNLQNEKQVALAFAKCYERCGAGSYKIRQQNAAFAYEYFTK